VLPGHVQVHHPDFLDDPSISNPLPFSDAALQKKFATPDLGNWASRVRVPAVISSERESRAVTLLGVDPSVEQLFSFFDYADVEGRFLTDTDDNGIVIGRKLAATLDTEPGKRIVIMTQDPENEIADRGFRIVGLYTADPVSVEEAYAYVGKSTAQSLLGVGDTSTEAVFFGDDYRNVEALYGKVSAALDDTVAIQRWYEIDTYLGTMLKTMDGFVLVWIIVIFLALSFGLVNTLAMAVFERVREIGLMLALGMKPSSILGQIIIESMMLLVLGLTIGNILAIATILPLQEGIDISMVAEGMEMMGASSVLYPKFHVADMILASTVVLLLGFLASLSPAWRASRYEPVEAITRV
jgi:ABC-type lipoprotein release transport system permease subunit